MSNQRRTRLVLASAAMFAAAAGSCARSGEPVPPESTSPSTAATAPDPDAPVLAPINAVRSVEPWSFGNSPGKIIRTSHYRLYTTETKPIIMRRLPSFLEAAIDQYRTAFAGEGEALPAPPLKLDTFVMSTRPEWERLTRQLMGADAAMYLRIPRGGYASGGRAVLFDVGANDTMSIAAHEGWHQYTQRAFKAGLPVWLEEGIATYMEGHRWTGELGDTVVFRPWANVERFDQLRLAASGVDGRGAGEGGGKMGPSRLMSLEEVLHATPAGLLGGGVAGSEDVLVYYAQVWALVHFLHEGEGGKYQRGLWAVVRDASDGRLYSEVARIRGQREASNAAATRRGTEVFTAYFNADLDAASAEFARFLTAVARPGSRSAIAAGTSPLADGAK